MVYEIKIVLITPLIQLSLLFNDHELIIVVFFLLIFHVGFASIKGVQDICRRKTWGQCRYRRIKNVVNSFPIVVTDTVSR